MRLLASARPVWITAVIAALLGGCSDAGRITEPARPSPAAASELASTISGAVVDVGDVEALYVAINDPANAGTRIVLAPGTYVLSARDPAGIARPNAGRIELQQDMSISGLTGDRSAVTIDATALPPASFPTSFGRTGVIRTGRGSNAVEWLTSPGIRSPRPQLKPTWAAHRKPGSGSRTSWLATAHAASM